MDPVPQSWAQMWQQCRLDGHELAPSIPAAWAQQELPDIGYLRLLSFHLRNELQADNLSMKQARSKAWADWFSQDWGGHT